MADSGRHAKVRLTEVSRTLSNTSSVCPQKDSNLRTWLRRPCSCTEILTCANLGAVAGTFFRVATKHSAYSRRSRMHKLASAISCPIEASQWAFDHWSRDG